MAHSLFTILKEGHVKNGGLRLLCALHEQHEQEDHSLLICLTFSKLFYPYLVFRSSTVNMEGHRKILISVAALSQKWHLQIF